jgi:hypothetical protein
MKKILLILTSCLQFSCNNTQTTGYSGNQILDWAKPSPVVQEYDKNGYVNQAFGYSIPVIPSLILQSDPSLNSMTFFDARSASNEDFIMVIPFTESLDQMAQNLQSAGTPFNRGNGVITFNIDQPGVSKMAGTFAASPYGEGGIGIIRIVTGGIYIQDQTITQLFSGIKFYPPQASFSDRNAMMESDIEKQKQSSHDDKVMQMFRDQLGYNPFN